VGLTVAVQCLMHSSMSLVMDAPVDWIKSVGSLRFPPKADHRLRNLMDRNNEGLLDPSEREELEALAELSEELSLVRAKALQILGKQPE
jgi:hypothetical protein